MFDQPYNFQFLGEKKTLIKDPVSKINYRFKAKKRKYFVTIEVFSTGLAAVKYCDAKDIGAHNAYKKIFNDLDAFRVITTCLFIMRDHWKKYPHCSFAFYAVPRDWKDALFKGKTLSESQKILFIEKYRNVRFSIYNYAMLNLFPPENFTPFRDSKNSIYVLVTKSRPRPKVILNSLTKYLFANHNLIFEADEE